MFENIIANGIGSIIGGLVVALALKVGLATWKKIILSASAFAVLATVITLVIFGSIKLVDGVNYLHEKQNLQSRIDRYLKGNYNDAFNAGWKIHVEELSPKVFLAFTRPDDVASYTMQHPLANPIVVNEVTKLLNNEGFPGYPLLGYEARTFSQEEIQKLYESQSNLASGLTNALRSTVK